MTAKTNSVILHLRSKSPFGVNTVLLKNIFLKLLGCSLNLASLVSCPGLLFIIAYVADNYKTWQHTNRSESDNIFKVVIVKFFHHAARYQQDFQQLDGENDTFFVIFISEWALLSLLTLFRLQIEFQHVSLLLSFILRLEIKIDSLVNMLLCRTRSAHSPGSVY